VRLSVNTDWTTGILSLVMGCVTMAVSMQFREADTMSMVLHWFTFGLGILTIGFGAVVVIKCINKPTE
jgi:hypothetical protein